MDDSYGIEHLQFCFSGARVPQSFAPVLIGVVGSGNLEVLVEPAEGKQCIVNVETSARGYRAIWEAVVADFHAQHGLAGVVLSIHDMGATPAVVSLRLQQAVAGLEQAAP